MAEILRSDPSVCDGWTRGVAGVQTKSSAGTPAVAVVRLFTGLSAKFSNPKDQVLWLAQPHPRVPIHALEGLEPSRAGRSTKPHIYRYQSVKEVLPMLRPQIDGINEMIIQDLIERGYFPSSGDVITAALKLLVREQRRSESEQINKELLNDPEMTRAQLDAAESDAGLG